MGNIIKINIYADKKRQKKSKLEISSLEKNILKYNKWLKDTKKEDKIESYKEFLQAE